MRRILLAAIALCGIAKTAHAEPGMNLRWDACFADGGTVNKAFACDTQFGADALVLSFVPPTVMDSVNAIEFTLDIVGYHSASWWQFSPGSVCRPGTIGITVDPTRFPSMCSTAFVEGCAPSFLAFEDLSTISAGRHRIRGRVLREISPPYSTMHGGGSELLLAVLYVSHANPRGCDDCRSPACIGLTQLKLVGPTAARTTYLHGEVVPGGSTVTWQSGVASSALEPGPTPATTYRTILCSAAVPARNHTWGSIKSLYH